MKFHRRCGDRVTLLNDNSTAIRNFVEFNHGLILSAEPIKDDVIFEVTIDRKVSVWNGSLEIGVTTLEPEHLELPATATKLRNTAWILSGSSIVKDGVTLVNSYGPELDSLHEGDCVGVMRSKKGELIFYINGRSLGVAAKDVPPRLHAVIDLYGQCVQVSIVVSSNVQPVMHSSLDQVEEEANNDGLLSPAEGDVAGALPETSQAQPKQDQDTFVPMTSEGACALVAQDHLRFHPRCGILVKLSCNNKTAERARPLDDYNNGVVMTHRPVFDNELFEIRIDRLVDKWSGSIEVGVTTHNPATIRFPSTMTNMDTGTIMMSGCKVLLNGHGTCMEYGNFNLDELREGDTVGMMKKTNGKLHYFINGVDQGVATDKVEQQVWGVVDLYGMTVKVTIVDPCEDAHTNVQPARSSSPEPSRCARVDEDSLLFHTLRDSNVIIINDGKTAHRPNAFKYFNNGIVMTNRTLKTNELFQVRLDLVISKWAGSIEIGVTQQSSKDIQTPFKMSNSKSGTWALTGEDVIRDGTIIIPQYVRNLNRLVEGETVGVMRTDMGILHFFVNGVDQGPAAFNIPEHVFGIIDLYGRVAQATIADTYIPPPPLYSPESPISSESNATIYPEMCFHRIHGRNARLSRTRLTASRATVYSEFNDAVLFSARPLRECDMFELRIDKMVDCWIGSLEIGVTAIRPEELESGGGVGAVAGTATDLSWDTYVLSGSAMMKDGECVRSGYPLDLDTLTVGSRVGMMWHADRSLHYYLDGMDMGRAWYVPHLNIYAVVDLYGQCTQVTILQNEERAFNFNGCTNSDNSLMNLRAITSPPPPYWSFSEYCGNNICLMYDYSIARRLMNDPTGTLVFSTSHLIVGEIFEIKIMECKSVFAGTFRMGVTDVNILNAHVNRGLPPAMCYLPHYTAYIDGRYMKYSIPGSRDKELRTFVPSFEWLRTGDRIGFKMSADGRVHVYYNSELVDTCFEGVPDKVYVVMELYGNVVKIQAVTRGTNNITATLNQTIILNDEIEDRSNNMYNITYNLDDVLPFSTNIRDEESNIDFVEGPPEVSDVGAVPPPVDDDDDDPDDDDDENNEAREDGAANNDAAAFPLPNGTDYHELPAFLRPAQPPSLHNEYVERENHSHTMAAVALLTTEARRQRHPLPYTFHYIHGKNVRLCSSDTVAYRTSGYNNAVAIVSQPLRRGHNFRFRVDKVDVLWSGSASIGAVGILPTEEVPICGMHFNPPIWIASSDLIHDSGTFLLTTLASCLDGLTEQSVLTLHFRFNSELVLDLDGTIVGVIGTVARNFSHVFPLIDLYGRVQQVSVLLHPYPSLAALSGASLDLPIIEENLAEESLAELDLDDDEYAEAAAAGPSTSAAARRALRPRAFSQENLAEEDLEALYAQAGPSSAPDRFTRSPPVDNEIKNKQIKGRVCPSKLSLHQSLILTDNTALSTEPKASTSSIQKSHSTHNFGQVSDEDVALDTEGNNLRHSLSAGSRVGAEGPAAELCDTNIRHNDRYPEASDVDNLDNEIMDALTLETGNLPDLTEEQSSSIDESTRRDDIWSETLSVENLNYLSRILCLDQEGAEAQSLESEWEASGEGCEHLHLVLKYWNFLVLPYPELRRAVSWGQVRCYCANCQPDAQPPLAGWVRIERIDGVGACQRAFWHVARHTLGSAQAQAGPSRRPRCLAPAPSVSPPLADIWFDEEGKPHHTVLAIEIDVEGSDAENDRLLAFLIYVSSHMVFIDDNPPSLDE